VTLNNSAFTPLGVVGGFTASFWIKPAQSITNTLSRGPRLFLFGPGITDNNGTVNDISLYFQSTNDIVFKYDNSILSAPINYNPLPTNVWMFIAISYDGTNNASMYIGTEASPAKLVTVRSIGQQTVDFSAGANLLIGNRTSDRARSFSGFLDEFRFYSGIGDSNFVESLRQMSTPIVVSKLFPDGTTLLEGTNQLTFNASPLTASATVESQCWSMDQTSPEFDHHRSVKQPRCQLHWIAGKYCVIYNGCLERGEHQPPNCG